MTVRIKNFIRKILLFCLDIQITTHIKHYLIQIFHFKNIQKYLNFKKYKNINFL